MPGTIAEIPLELVAPVDDLDLIEIQDVSDTTDTPEGSSKKVTFGQALASYLKNNAAGANALAVGGIGTERIIEHVADGTGAKHAVNLGQFEAKLPVAGSGLPTTTVHVVLTDAAGAQYKVPAEPI
jgi:hypothetical protein